jgi:hypothetical protein
MINLICKIRFLIKGHLIWCPLFFLVLGCVNPQKTQEEYNLAQGAFKSSQESEAKRYAPKVFYQAKKYLRRARRAYKQRDYDKATSFFQKSRYYSEKAENISRLKQFKQGEMAP